MIWYVILTALNFFGWYFAQEEDIDWLKWVCGLGILGSLSIGVRACNESFNEEEQDKIKTENNSADIYTFDVIHNKTYTFKVSEDFKRYISIYCGCGCGERLKWFDEECSIPMLHNHTVIGVEFGIDSKAEQFINTSDILTLLKNLAFECKKLDGNINRLSNMLGCSTELIYKWLNEEIKPNKQEEVDIRMLYRDFEYSRHHHLIYFNRGMSQFETLAKNWELGNVKKFRECKNIFANDQSCFDMLLELRTAMGSSNLVANYLECSSAAIERLLNKETEPTDEFLHRVKNMYLSFVLLNKDPNILQLVRYGIGQSGIFSYDFFIDYKVSPQLNEWTDSLEPGVEQYENNVSNNNLDSITIEQYIKNEEKLNEAFVSSICKTIDSISKHQIAKFEEDKLADNLTNIKDLYLSDKHEFNKIIKNLDSTYFGPQHFYPQLKIIESDYISKVKKTRAHFVKAYKVRVDVNVDSFKIPLISTKGLKNYTEDIAADYIYKKLPKEAVSVRVSLLTSCSKHPVAIPISIAVEGLADRALDKIFPSDADSITEILKKDIDSQSVINPEEINSFINLLNNNSRSFYEKIL